MFKLTVLLLVISAVCGQQGNQRSFIQKCSLKDPNIDQCFVTNANKAIEELNQGVDDLQIPNLDGFDFGNLLLGIGKDLPFRLEDVKGYQKGLKLENAHLYFDSNKSFKRVSLSFTLFDAVWFAKYHALGFLEGHEVNETGNAQIRFGNVTIDSTLDFKRKVVDGVAYLKARSNVGSGKHEKFEFMPSNAKGDARPLGPEQFQQLENPAVSKALEIALKYIIFIFNQILQEIPESELFLP